MTTRNEVAMRDEASTDAVDFHAHLAPEDPAAPPFMRALFDVEGYLEKQAAAGIGLTLLSYTLEDPPESDKQELERAKREHEFLAGLVSSHPGRFGAFATVDPFGGEAWLAEAERALGAGFSGLCFPTSRNGRYLDAEDAKDAFALAEQERAIVFVHPSAVPVTLDRIGDPMLSGWIGRPYDTGICLARLLLANTVADYPNVRIVVAHSGGVLPMLLGRLDQVHETLQRVAAMLAGVGAGGPPGGGPPGGGPPGGGPPGGGPPGRGGPPGNMFGGEPLDEEHALSPSVGGDAPSRRLDRYYVDTASFHPVAIQAGIATVGVDRVVVGTDHPPAADSPQPALDALAAVELSVEDREKILFRNARALLER